MESFHFYTNFDDYFKYFLIEKKQNKRVGRNDYSLFKFYVLNCVNNLINLISRIDKWKRRNSKVTKS